MDPTAEEIRAALARIVSSPQFSGAERLRRFLSYVVDRAIEGRADELKEFVVATAVFDRDQSYDPRLDAVVRVEAGRLRSRLAEYYGESGVDDPLVIRIPKGGYAPAFERRAAPVAPDSAPALVPQARPAFAATWVIGALAAAAVMTGVVLVWTGSTRVPAATVASASVAVLPLDGDTDGSGAASLSRALAGTGTVDVVANRQVREAIAQGNAVGQIATMFRADYTVEGRVEARGGMLTVELVLVDAHAARKIWVQSFTGGEGARDTLIREAAVAVANAVEARRHAAR